MMGRPTDAMTNEKLPREVAAAGVVVVIAVAVVLFIVA